MQRHRWLRGPFAFGIVAALVACSVQRAPQTSRAPSSQESYAYPGCFSSNAECPRLGTLTCAVWAIARKYNGCSSHDECVTAAIQPRCSGLGTCPPFFLNRQWKAAFEGEAQAQIDRYCQSASCTLPGLCPVPASVQGYCASGHCTWINTTGP